MKTSLIVLATIILSLYLYSERPHCESLIQPYYKDIKIKYVICQDWFGENVISTTQLFK
jgi:hypothetical protein